MQTLLIDQNKWDFFSWCKRTDDIFNITILFNFVSIAVVICLVGFCVLYSDNVVEIMRFGFGLVTCIMQIRLLCWLGDCFIVYVSELSLNKTLFMDVKIFLRALTSAIVPTTAHGMLEVLLINEVWLLLFIEVRANNI